MPLLKDKKEDSYQPVFTDVLEFQKFNRENRFRTADDSGREDSGSAGAGDKGRGDQSDVGQSAASDPQKEERVAVMVSL